MALSRQLREQFNDFAKWWNWHSDKVMTYPPEQRQKFLMEALNSQNYLLVELAREVDGPQRSILSLPKNFTFGAPAQ